jgi:hypothetical protein
VDYRFVNVSVASIMNNSMGIKDNDQRQLLELKRSLNKIKNRVGSCRPRTPGKQ